MGFWDDDDYDECMEEGIVAYIVSIIDDIVENCYNNSSIGC